MATPKTKKSEEIVSGRGSYRADKKEHKSIKKENKKAVKSANKKNRSSERSFNKMAKEGTKQWKKELKEAPHWDYHNVKHNKPIYEFSEKHLPQIKDPGDKPKRSDYKGSKPGSRPQRATGSSASKKRNAAMITKMNKLHRGR